jgi:hypothetical protein
MLSTGFSDVVGRNKIEWMRGGIKQFHIVNRPMGRSKVRVPHFLQGKA